MISERVLRIALFLLSCLLVLGGCKKSPFTPDPQNLTRPVIWLSSYELSFVGFEAGANPAAQVLKVKNSGQKSLSYTVADDAEWLRIDPANGSSSGQFVEHTILIDKTNLSAREDPYSATISVVCAEAYNNPQKVRVTLQLSAEPPPEIWVRPAELSFTANLGTNPSSQTIRLKNTGKGTLSYTLTSDEAWLSVSPGSGTSSGEEKSHTVAIDTTGMAEGSYEGMITIADPSATNNPQKVKVALKISKEPAPAIAISPGQLIFQAFVGQNPSAQYLSIRNSGGGTLNYIIAHNASWLSVSPTSGTSTGQDNFHRVSVTVGGLSIGVHQAVITITDPKAVNSPQQVPVTLDVSSLPSDNEISISCSPASGRTDDLITIPVSIKGNIKDITVFGLDFTFDTNLFQYQGIAPGGLTGSWATVDGNVISAGTLRIGGFTGSGTPIPTGSNGTIAVITLKVTGTGFADGQTSQLSIFNYADDVEGMTPLPSTTTFTYRKS